MDIKNTKRKKNYKKIANILIVGFLFTLLIGIRFYESVFYDPLQAYFKFDYLHKSLPDMQMGKLFLHTFLRYMLNSMLSILIIWVAFRRKSFVKFSMYFYSIAFIILILAFWLSLQTHFDKYYLFGFYVRRFLIQPIFVLLLLPAFYYQLRSNSITKNHK